MYHFGNPYLQAAGGAHAILRQLRSLLAGFDKAGQWQNSIAHAVQFPGAWCGSGLGLWENTKNGPGCANEQVTENVYFWWNAQCTSMYKV